MNIHRKKTPNLGDLSSASLKYFKKTKNSTFLDILDCEQPDERISSILNVADYLIIAGGGLLENPKFSAALEYLVKKYSSKIIIWGAGANSVGIKFVKNDLENVTHIGLRDIDTIHQWVPCSSCMHPDLIEIKKNKNLIYKGGAGIIENDSGKDAATVSNFGIPDIRRLGNKKIQAREMFEFIAGSDLIITSSFHAVYWSILLETPVIGIPTSIKFSKLRHSIPLATKGNWINELGRTKVYPNALKECIDANIKFIASLPFALQQELVND